MAVVCSEIGEDFPLQGIQDHLFDSGDEDEEEESCESAFKYVLIKTPLAALNYVSLSQMWRQHLK